MVTAFALSMLFTASASTQDGILLWRTTELDPQTQRGDSEWRNELYFRYTAIGGSADDVDDWSDFFENGVGFRLETEYEYHFDDRWSIEGYLSVGLDFFEGKDSGGVSFDDWLITQWMLGAKGKIGQAKGWYEEMYLGIGFVRYNDVNATTLGVSVPVFTESIAVAFEIGVHIGYRFSKQFAVSSGVGYETWGDPSVSSDLKAQGVSSVNPIENVTLDIGISFMF